MIIVFQNQTPEAEICRIAEIVKGWGFFVLQKELNGNTILLCETPQKTPYPDLISAIKASEYVESITHNSKPYHLVSKENKEKSLVDIGGDVQFGEGFEVIAGPCTIESYESLSEIAKQIKNIGIKLLRGGVFKPTTSPYSYSGLGEEGIQILKAVKEEIGLKIVVEALHVSHLEILAGVADIIQIGARNMQNFELLKQAGKMKTPVLLKRHFGCTIEEWLCSAEYIYSEGNENIILCERGIRTFEKSTRSTLDISAVPLVKSLSHLPVITDPSHSAGDRRLVSSLALASCACGADGVMLEAHVSPEVSVKDGAQTISMEELRDLHRKLMAVSSIVNNVTKVFEPLQAN